MTVSMVILNYNDYALTTEYVERIKQFSLLDHIIIVDNHSPDGSYNHLCGLKSNKVDIIQTSENKGYAYGNNEGIRFLCKKYGSEGIVFISNPDIVVDEKSINKIVDSFDQYDNQFAATGEVHSLSGERVDLFTWRLPDSGILFIENSVVLRNLIRKIFHYSRRYSDLQAIDHGSYYCGEALPGCFFAVDLSKFIDLGMFSEKTFLYYEEEILFSKAKNLNYNTRVIKNAPIIHAEGATTKKNIKSWRKRERILEDSCVVYMRDCLGTGKHMCSLYRFVNRFFLPERYFLYRLKEYLMKKQGGTI